MRALAISFLVSTLAACAGDHAELLALLDSSNPAPESGLVNDELRVTYLYDPHPDAGAVEELKLRVLLDGAEIAAAELAPEHALHQPNGPGCGPGCLVAHARLEMDVGAIGGSPAGDGG